MEILAVVVRYNVSLEESQTIAGLASAFKSDPDLQSAFEVLIWDNSPTALIEPFLPFPFLYHHSVKNEGVSGAYNQATSIAFNEGATWLLLLDQDTSLTESYLAAMLRESRALTQNKTIAAIAPIVRVGDLVVSPRRALFNTNRPFTGKSGVVDGEGFAINSGCLMRVETLRAIGGFSSDFWLDYSDMYVFHQFFLHGLGVWRLIEAELQHEMTIMDYDGLMAPWRYENFIEAEGAFNDLYKGRLENLSQTLRLVVRAVRQRLRYKNPEFSRLTLRHLGTRLSMGRQRRLEVWRDRQRSRQ